MTMPSMPTLCDALDEHVPQILVEWHLLTVEEPWLSLPEDQRVDDLSEVVLGLIDAAICASGDRTPAVRDLVAAAMGHGRHRRASGFAHELLLTEYYVLREAIWRYLKRLAEPGHGSAILYLDRAVTTATRASMVAFHAADLPEGERLQRIVQTLVSDAAGSLDGA